MSKTGNGTCLKWISDHLNFSGENCLIWPFNRDRRNGRAMMTVNRSTINPARFICEKLYGPAPTPKHEAAHYCGNGHLGCVHPRHVRWATHQENEADKKLHKTAAIGVRHGMADLSEKDVRKIRTSIGTYKQIGIRFGISEKHAWRIKNGQSWRHLDRPVERIGSR